MWASIRYDDDAMMRAALGCCASIALALVMRCFKSASTSAISLPLTLSEAMAVNVCAVLTVLTVWANFSDRASLLWPPLRGSLMLSLMGVMSVTAKALVELDAVIRPLSGRSNAFNVLCKSRERVEVDNHQLK